MITMSISVPDDMQAFVEARMAEEGYASASEYMRTLIRNAQMRQAQKKLDEQLLDGLKSPAGEMTSADWDALRHGIRAKNPELKA